MFHLYVSRTDQLTTGYTGYAIQYLEQLAGSNDRNRSVYSSAKH